jgi:FkbM family methyltransferase
MSDQRTQPSAHHDEPRRWPPPLARRLRPAKIRAGLRRRWFELRLERTPLVRGPGLVKLGSSYGGWIVPDGLIEPSWICYCVGAGGDVSFDLELIRRYGATVRAFDPVAEYVESAIEQAAGEPRFSAHQAAVAASDGPVRMQVTHDARSRSVSSAGLYESTDYIELPGRSLTSLMSELGDEQIDLLKLDIEGSEYELLPTVDLRGLGVKVFAAQLHHTGSVKQARALVAALGRAGYEPVARRSAVKLTFAQRSLL